MQPRVFAYSQLLKYLFYIPSSSFPNMNKVAPLDCEQSAISIINLHHLLSPPTSPTHETTKVCKICLDEEITTPDILMRMTESELIDMELIVPCECSGSMGYVHQKCIRTWIQKQIRTCGKKDICCEICKSQLFFQMRRLKYCECSFQNLSLISGCSILSATIELFLLIVSILILRYSLNLSQSSLLKYVLIVLICIVALAFALTILLIIGQAFIKHKKEISRIFSIQESVQMGLREARVKTSNNLPKSNNNLSRSCKQIPLMRSNGNNKITNTHCPTPNHRHSNLAFIEINPLSPGHNF